MLGLPYEDPGAEGNPRMHSTEDMQGGPTNRVHTRTPS